VYISRHSDCTATVLATLTTTAQWIHKLKSTVHTKQIAEILTMYVTCTMFWLLERQIRRGRKV